MTIEKTYKVTIKAIKDTSFYLDETEINELYQQCRKALNIDVKKIDTVQPNDYPSWNTNTTSNVNVTDMTQQQNVHWQSMPSEVYDNLNAGKKNDNI